MPDDPVGASGHRLTTSTFRWLVPVRVLERPWARRVAWRSFALPASSARGV
jgi:hypothetical protein